MKRTKHVIADNGGQLCMFSSTDFRITPTTETLNGKLTGRAEDTRLGRMVRIFEAVDGRVFWIYSDWSAKRIR